MAKEFTFEIPDEEKNWNDAYLEKVKLVLEKSGQRFVFACGASTDGNIKFIRANNITLEDTIGLLKHLIETTEKEIKLRKNGN